MSDSDYKVRTEVDGVVYRGRRSVVMDGRTVRIDGKLVGVEVDNDGNQLRHPGRGKLIEYETREVLPGGALLTALHLTEEAKRGLSTNGVEIPGDPQPLPIARVQRQNWLAKAIAWIKGLM